MQSKRVRLKRGALAGIVAGVIMAIGYMVIDWVAPAAATTMIAVEEVVEADDAAETAPGEVVVAERTSVPFRSLGFIYYLARIGVGFLVGLVWGLFYAAVEQHVWGIGFIKGIVFGAAVWLLGGLPDALNKYLTYEFGGLLGLWAFGGLLVSILGGVAVSLIYGRVDYDDSKREPIRVNAQISGGGTEQPAPENTEALPPIDL